MQRNLLMFGQVIVPARRFPWVLESELINNKTSKPSTALPSLLAHAVTPYLIQSQDSFNLKMALTKLAVAMTLLIAAIAADIAVEP